MSWFVYLLECNNGNLYCGATNDLDKRFQAHASGKGSKAVRAAGGPKEFAYTTPVAEGRGPALSLEYVIKSLKRQERLLLIAANHQGQALTRFLQNVGVLDDGK